MKKRSVKILRHSTSISLEEEFWTELKSIATERDISLNALIGEIDKKRRAKNLSSAIRLYILRHLKEKAK